MARNRYRVVRLKAWTRREGFPLMRSTETDERLRRRSRPASDVQEAVASRARERRILTVTATVAPTMAQRDSPALQREANRCRQQIPFWCKRGRLASAR